MARHQPFAHRRRHQPPVYIGFDHFDQPMRPRRRSNWWGVGGLLVTFMSCGIFSPVGLLMSLIGLTRRPRSAAFVGTFFSLIGTSVIALGIIGAISEEAHHHRHHEYVRARQLNEKLYDESLTSIGELRGQLGDFRSENDDYLPDELEGNVIAVKIQDAWGNPLRYDITSDGALLRSAGADKEFETHDDLVKTIAGKTDRKTLLPIDGSSSELAESPAENDRD